LNRRFCNKNKRALRYSQFGLIRHVRTCESVKLWSPRSLGINSPADISKAELASMLPGFRFLFAAIVLSMSILVFGLGAAALLRAAHEEFANLPSRRAPPEPVFARLNDDPMPSLALLRVDLPVAEKPLDDVRAAAVPEAASDIVAPLETAADERPVEPEKVAALSMEERPPAPPNKAIAEKPAAPVATEAPVADVEVVAAIGETSALPAASSATPAVPAPDVLVLEGNAAATRIATLGGPAVIVDERTSATLDRSAVRKRALQRAREQRRIALARRARLAREAALTLQQQQPNPFTPAPATAPAPTPLLRFTR